MSVRRLLWSILASQIAVVAFGASSQSLDPATAVELVGRGRFGPFRQRLFALKLK